MLGHASRGHPLHGQGLCIDHVLGAPFPIVLVQRDLEMGPDLQVMGGMGTAKPVLLQKPQLCTQAGPSTLTAEPLSWLLSKPHTAVLGLGALVVKSTINCKQSPPAGGNVQRDTLSRPLQLGGAISASTPFSPNLSHTCYISDPQLGANSVLLFMEASHAPTVVFSPFTE